MEVVEEFWTIDIISAVRIFLALVAIFLCPGVAGRAWKNLKTYENKVKVE